MSSRMIEKLEDRQLLAVTAASVFGFMQAGNTWVRQMVNAKGKTIGMPLVETALTAGSAGGAQILNLQTSLPGGAGTIDRLYAVDPEVGLICYGQGWSLAGGPSAAAKSSSTFAPWRVIMPFSMDAGLEHTSVWSSQTGTSFNGAAKNTGGFNSTSVKLRSETRQSVKVPAGTFACYVLESVQTFGSSSGTPGTTPVEPPPDGQLPPPSPGAVVMTVKETLYVAPGVGEVKRVETVTVSGKPARTSTRVLTSFSQSPSPSPAPRVAKKLSKVKSDKPL